MRAVPWRSRGSTVAVPQCCGRPWNREVGTVGLVLWYCGSVVDRGAVVYGTGTVLP